MQNEEIAETPQGGEEILNPPPSAGSLQKRKYWMIGSLAVLLGVLGFASYYYATFLSARVAPGIAFRILGPDSVTLNQPAVITWDISTQGVAMYPAEKIEFCAKKQGKKCVTLAESVPNNGQATVNIPASFPEQTGYFKFTARNQKGRLFNSIVSIYGPVAVLQTSVPTPSIEIATPPPPYSPYGGTVALNCPPPYVDVNGDGALGQDDYRLVVDYINGNTAPIAKTGAKWQNQVNSADVNGDGSVTPMDALSVANQVSKGTGAIADKDCPPLPYSPYNSR